MIYQKCFGTGTHGEIILVHGLGEHSGRHTKIIERLVATGYTVCAFDLPGHGKSSGKRGHTTIPHIVEIINSIIDRRASHPFLLGYSLGGLAVLRYAECYPYKVAGIIASGPPLVRRVNLSRGSVVLSKLLGVLIPTITVNNTIRPKDLSRDETAVRRYYEDPCVHDRISAALARSLFVEMQRTYRESHRIIAPVLILNGTADTLSPLSGAEQFMHLLSTKNKHLHRFPNSCHEIFEDPEWGQQFYEVILAWLERLTSDAIDAAGGNHVHPQTTDVRDDDISCGDRRCHPDCA
jgi:lysophospholipase